MCHPDGAGSKTVGIAKCTLALHVLIDVIVGRVEVIGHILVVDPLVDLKELIFGSTSL